MKMLGTNTARISWRQQRLETEFSEDLWPSLRSNFTEHAAVLDAACAAALAGPIRFTPTPGEVGDLVAPHLAGLKELAFNLGNRMALELHDERSPQAWTNLMALTRLATAWNPEPLELSHYMRFLCVSAAYGATWEALQAGHWTDSQLAALQREWEEASFFGGLAETAALSRAGVVSLCRYEYEHAPSSSVDIGGVASDLFRAPGQAWSELTSPIKEMRYRQHGLFMEEKTLLLYLRDRELEIRQATNAPSWAVMRSMPGVTNSVQPALQSPGLLSIVMISSPGSQRSGPVLLARAAEVEAKRRILVTAIALERYKLRHGNYPATLAQLKPAFVKSVFVDFMNEEPLRYLSANDGFMVYSVGLDTIDDGGRAPRSAFGRYGRRPQYTGGWFANRQGTDVVWPRVAAPEEVASDRIVNATMRAQLQAEQEQTATSLQMDSALAAEFQKRYGLRPAATATNSPPASPPKPAGNN
jgi:hypothetical protein